MERTGSFYFSDGAKMDAEALSQKYNFDWDDVIDILLQLTNPENDREAFADYCAVVRGLKLVTVKDDLHNLGLDFINEISTSPYHPYPEYTRMNDAIDAQIDKEREAEANSAPRFPDGSRVPGTTGHVYSREDRRRQIQNGEENRMWEEARQRMPWLFRG